MSTGTDQRETGAHDGGRVDQVDDLVERVTTKVSSTVARVVARTREEAEDIWVEAKNVRRGAGQGTGNG
jgi:hypothetical protein